MEKWRATIRNIGKILQEFELNALTNGVLSLASTAFSVYVGGLNDISFLTLFLIAVLLVCFYLIVHIIVKMLNLGGGLLINFSEKWYPEWLYRPTFDYYLKLGFDKILTIYIKSNSKKRNALLRLDFSRLRLMTGSDEQKYAIAVASGNHRNILYNKEIVGDALMTIPISGKSTDGKNIISFYGDPIGISLIPGRYSYEFIESGKYKKVGFSGKRKKLTFTYNDKGEFEV